MERVLIPSTARQQSHKINKVPLFLQNLERDEQHSLPKVNK